MVGEVECFGHIVSGKGVRANPKKSEAMARWPRPAHHSETIKGFLWINIYYRN